MARKTNTLEIPASSYAGHPAGQFSRPPFVISKRGLQDHIYSVPTVDFDKRTMGVDIANKKGTREYLVKWNTFEVPKITP